MSTRTSLTLLEKRYLKWEQEYLHSLPLEHFMEATPQGRQREITLESLALVRAQRADFHVFNELLVQYPKKDGKKPGQVVPDNMVVIHDGPINAIGSFNYPLQTSRPFLILEYVSPSSKRKDYVDNKYQYEHEMKVPYYLLFEPEIEALKLYHHNGRKYVGVKPNENGRYPISDLEMEIAVVDGWVRYWFQGELLLLPGELLKKSDDERQRADDERQRANDERQRADDERRRAETAEKEAAQLRAELEELRKRPKNGRA